MFFGLRFYFILFSSNLYAIRGHYKGDRMNSEKIRIRHAI